MIDFRTLGAAELEGHDGANARPIALQAKRLALVAYVALAGSGRYRRRDSIVALFWPDLDDEHARSALRQALTYVRRGLGSSGVITRGEEEVAIAHEAVRCDAVLFDEAVAAGHLEDAMVLYRGDFLNGLFVSDASPELEQWIDTERVRLRQSAATCAWSLAERSRLRGDSVSAAEWARRAVALAPADEGKVRWLITLLDSNGDRAGAIAAYERFAAWLASEYSAEPSPETNALIGAVRSRSVAAGDTSGLTAFSSTRERTSRSRDQVDLLPPTMLRIEDAVVSVPLRARSWRWPTLVTVGGLAIAAVLSRPSPSRLAPPTRQQFTFSGRARAPALAPDGRTIAYVEESCPAAGGTCSQELVVQDLAGIQTVPLARATLIDHPKWNPAGGSVLFQAIRVLGAPDTTSGGAYLVQRLGGVPQRIGPEGAAAFSTNGDTVVLGRRETRDTIRLRFLRSADTEVFDSASVPVLNGGLYDLDWSPDGKWLALLIYRGEGDRRVVLASRNRGMVTDSMMVPGRRLVRWVPAGDAVLLLLAGGSSDDIVFRLGVDRRTGHFTTDTVTEVKIPAGGPTFDVSRDGTMLAFVNAARTTSELIAMERVGERVTARSLLSFTGWSGTPVLSPDGRTIALPRGDALGANLYLIPFEGGAPHPITSARDHFAAPVWLRDERLVFKRGLPSTQLFVVTLRDAQPRRFGPAGYTTGNPWYLQWLDDSLYVLDQRDHHRVLVLDSSGSIRDTLTVPETLDQLLAVTPDARELWFFDRASGLGFAGRRFYSLDRVTKLVKIVFDVPPNYGLLGWADDAYLVATWPNRTASSPTVWRVNPGSTFTRVAVLPADCDFRSLSMSRDGRRFVCRRTDARTDIWLLRGLNLGRQGTPSTARWQSP